MKEKSFEREKELLEAALDEFTMKNYEEASLNNIIKKAGISKGTFYYHFRDKQSLYLYLLEHSVKTKWEFINNRIKEYAESYEEKDIFEKFKLQARIGAEFATAFPKYHMLSKMFTKEKGNKIYEVAKDVLGKDTDESLEKMIYDAVDRGDFRNEFPREFMVKIISHLFMNFDEIFNSEEDFELERMLKNLDNYVDFIKYGLGK
ncbi:MAG TPA: TetR/AcrR family transcriptional regulator [Bacteroidales bacterium]|nr:TetR/AcrR family transcriptional regulator [Bacteroidales bacterium]